MYKKNEGTKMKKTKVLIVMGGSFMGYGGIESMVMNYYRNLDKDRLQVDFVFFGDGIGLYDEELQNHGSRLFHLPIKSKHYIKSQRAMKSLLLTEQYDVVHANLNAAGILAAMKMAKKCRVPMRIAHAHSTNHGTINKIRWLLNDYARKNISKYSTHNFACSDIAGEWYFGKGQFVIVPNAIDAERFLFNSKVRNRVREDFECKDELVIGHVGNLGYPKNQIFLLHMFARMIEKGIHAQVWLIGEGEDHEELEHLAETLQISSKVKFLGKRQDVHELMQAMDVFVLPSFFEGFPVVVVEAAAADLPCVISDSITEMALLSDKVRMDSLNDEMDKWISDIEEVCRNERQNSLKLISEKGFNIKIEAKKLEHFYCTGRYE